MSISTAMERKGGHLDDAILLDDEDDGNLAQGYVESIDLEDEEMSQKAGNLPIHHTQSGLGKVPTAHMYISTKVEGINHETILCKPGQAKLESQAKAGAIAANIRKNHGELLRQRAEKLSIPAIPAATLDTMLSPQTREPKPKLIGQKLGFAALTDESGAVSTWGLNSQAIRKRK